MSTGFPPSLPLHYHTTDITTPLPSALRSEVVAFGHAGRPDRYPTHVPDPRHGGPAGGGLGRSPGPGRGPWAHWCRPPGHRTSTTRRRSNGPYRTSVSIPSPPAGESRYLVLRNFPVTVGILGFEGLPNERGEVEIGYSVLPDHQRAGSASEAVAALTRWAFSHPWVRRVMAETYPELTASRRVLGKNEFRLAGEG